VHSSKDINRAIEEEVIPEVSECEERDKSSLIIDRQQEAKADNLREMYQRIDQEEIEKLGLGSKKELGEEAISGLHEYSLLQRFRQNKDLYAVDDYQPKRKES